MDVALICGAEAVFTRIQARKTNTHLPWTQQPTGTPPPDLIGDDRPGTCDAETSRSLVLPSQLYPVFENALRAASLESVERHQAKVSELWARFSQVAETNPYAWTPSAMPAEQIRTVSAENRMVAFPYTKWLNANIQTDQAAALILCSAEAARSAGVPEDRWVFPRSGAEAHDHWFVTERDRLDTSPAIAAAGRAALSLADIGIDDIAHLDLYSCFPSAVQMAASALSLGLNEPDRPLTLTGGLTFGGGPGNNYATHAIATMAGALRADPGSVGLVSALGWYATKHALGIYSTEPPRRGFRVATDAVQSEVHSLPRRQIVTSYDGPVTIESFTVTYERDNTPALGIVACLLPDGGRTWGNTQDPSIMDALMSDGLFGLGATLSADGTVSIT